MKVVGACNLDNKTIMKDFYFDDDVTEDEVKKEVDDWAQSLVHTWYVICKSDEENIYGR